MAATTYVVLDAPIGAEDGAFFGRLESALQRADAAGLALELVDRREDATNIVLAYADARGAHRVELWDDYVCRCRYLRLEAPDAAALTALEKVLAELPVVTLRQLLAAARKRKEVRRDPAVLARLAFGAPAAYEPRVFETIGVAIDDELPEVRRFAAHAIGILGWRQFLPPLARRAEHEPPGEVKVAIERAIALILEQPG